MKSREIEHAKPELAVERRFSELQVKVLNYEYIFGFFFYRMEAYMENNENALLGEDEEGVSLK